MNRKLQFVALGAVGALALLAVLGANDPASYSPVGGPFTGLRVIGPDVNHAMTIIDAAAGNKEVAVFMFATNGATLGLVLDSLSDPFDQAISLTSTGIVAKAFAAVGGQFIGNGAGLTNVPGTSITGSVVATNNMTVVRTNFVSGQVYTNDLGVPLLVSSMVKYTTAAVAGDAALELRIAGTGGVTNTAGASTTVAVTLAQDETNMLSGIVPVNCTYTFTNVSAGVGNSAAPLAGQIGYTARWVVAPAQTYKVYRAVLTQSGTNVPVASVLENSLGGTPSFARTAAGVYTVTLSGAFTASKTFPNFSGGDPINGDVWFGAQPTDANSIVVTCFSYNAGDLTDFSGGAGAPAFLTILVYP